MARKKAPMTLRRDFPSLGVSQADSRQHEQGPGDNIKEDSPGRTEEPAASMAEDAPERLAEHPDDESPAGTNRTCCPGQGSPRGDQEKGSDADLDPHRRRRR